MIHLDHAVVLVHDLAAAERRYRRLGFVLTPPGSHPTLGTANHTIMFEMDYLELLAVIRRTAGNARWAAALDRREGLGAVAFGTADARALRQTLAGRGFSLGEVIDFARPVKRPEGPVEARFTVLHLPDEATPAIPGFFCQQHTPEYVWLPEFQRHPNTAWRVAGLTIVAPDPGVLGSAYDRLLGRAFVHPHPGGVAVDLRGTRLWIVSPAYAEARLGRDWDQTASQSASAPWPLPAGLSIAVRDLDAARRALDQGGTAWRPFGRHSILVGPEWADGVFLEFVGRSTR